MFTKDVYAGRRAALKKELNKGLAFFPANNEAPFNYPDNTYIYRQDSCFSYFFGLNHPDLVGVIDFETGEEILFGMEVSIDDIIWCGPLPSLKEQGEMIGISDCRDFNKFGEYLQQAIAKGRQIHILPTYRADTRIQCSQWLATSISEVDKYTSVELIKAVVKLREVKSPLEIAEIERAAVTAYYMHTAAMKMCKPGMVEQEIAGVVEGLSLSGGGAVSFPVILSVNGQTLHNHHHHNVLQEGRMMVCDAGAETENYYASDFTRTTPVGGKFNQRQREIYEIVLAANQAVAENTRPYIPYMDMHKLACRTLIEGLKGVGLMKGDTDEALNAGAHYLFMPHGLGHALGMDVHDMEGLGETYVGYDDITPRSTKQGFSGLRCGKTLKPGFVVTDEPGIYFIPTLIDLWKAEGKNKDFINYDKLETYKDFGGIRIEDDLLITENGCRIPGRPIPKTVSEVEDMCAQGREWIKMPGLY
ncbi:MAG: aminopeptidase P family protein [Bacteroidales bacterium]|nr:aminopeptidase P family protein [Bacteroidales bacterium]MCF0201109.1 aminopeptidase P family protein [Bacteroidales bacterium]MCF0201595.1 aminopeptidase P family protein [Bacteroidales bacterium]